MKRILLGLSLSLALTTLSFAQNKPTLESNEAAIKAGRTQISNKTTELESRLNAHNTAAAQTTAANLLDLMKQGMNQTRVKIDLHSGDRKKQEEINVHYLKLEQLTHDFKNGSTNVAANGTQLVSYAKSYLKEY